MKKRRNDGFTLIEVIVVAGIIAILAGILVPMIFKEIDESRITRAAADVRSISNALIVLKKDTGGWPVSASCATGTTLLMGDGSIPSISPVVTGWDVTTPVNYNQYLLNDDQGCWPNTWRGPYMAAVIQDPWGNSYITNADSFQVQGGAVWILSAGPNGVVDTPAGNNVTLEDDIGLRIK